MKLKKNVGTHDAHLRIVFGIFFLLFAIFLIENPTAKILLAVVATILAGTASLRFCPLYTLIHRTTYADTQTKNFEGETTTPSGHNEHQAGDSVEESKQEGGQ